MMKPVVCAALLATCQAGDTRAPEGEGWESLFDGTSLGGWKATPFGGEGRVIVKDGQIRFDAGGPLTGIHWTGEKALPAMNYEIALEAMKVDGSDFFLGLVFPVEAGHCSFVVGGWGGGVVGLSVVDGRFADENETLKVMNFPKGRWYKIRLKVTTGRIEAWVDQDKVVDLETQGKKISLHPAVELSKPLGIAAFMTEAAYREIKLRKLAEK